MSFTLEDELRLKALFEQKDNYEKESVEYYKYRDEIYSLAFKKLSDLFCVLKFNWKQKFKIDEDDSISIIHDGLLTAVTKYKLCHNGRMNKFITYLIHILTNLIKNHIKHRSAQRRIPSIFCSSLERLELAMDHCSHESQEDYDLPYKYLISYLSNKYFYFESQNNQKFFIEYFLNRLPEDQKFLVQSILSGYTLKEISKSLDLTTPGLRLRLKKLAQKFKNIENELCAQKKV